MTSSSRSILEIDRLEVCYGHIQALFGVTMCVGAGEFVGLLGRNGMGKSTIVKSIMGMIPQRSGAIRFDGKVVNGAQSYAIAQMGIGLVPEGRRIISTLTVDENLSAFAADRRHSARPWTLERVYRLFPKLKERSRALGRTLSGGEQQMLAIGRALVTNPKLLILDEATEGLAPIIREEIWSSLALLSSEGLSIIAIDKEIEPMLRLGSRHFIVEKGRIAWSGSSDEFRRNKDHLQSYLSV